MVGWRDGWKMDGGWMKGWMECQKNIKIGDHILYAKKIMKVEG
jgi:hypothetical protein